MGGRSLCDESEMKQPDYLDHLIQEAKESRPGFASIWEPNAHMLALSTERARLGLSQAEVAARMGVDRTIVTRMENDPAGVAFARILAYAQAIGAEIVVKPSRQKPKNAISRRGRKVGGVRNSLSVAPPVIQ